MARQKADPVKRAAYQRAYADAHATDLRRNRKAYEARHPDKMQAARRRWRVEHPEQSNAITLRRIARIRGAEISDLTLAQWEAIKAAHDHRCAYCGARVKLTQDHVIPLSKGGQHTASNIVPACQPCNSRKGNSTADAWVRVTRVML